MKQDNQKEAVLAYIAGIIDGEGSVGITKQRKILHINPRYTPYISLGMTNENVVRLCAKELGGTIYIERVQENRKEMYRVKVNNGNAIVNAIDKISPFLRIKKSQAEVVKKFILETKWRKGENRNRECKDCLKIKQIHAFNLCQTCFMRNRRNNTLFRYNKSHKSSSILPIKELQRREELYQKIRQLNAVGAPATTKRKDTREREVIV